MLRDLDVLPCGLLQTAEDGTIRQVNRTFCVWLEKPREGLIGKRFQDLLTVGGKIFHHTHWAPLLRMQGSISEVKLELVHAGKAPAAILIAEPDAILLLGLVVAREMGWPTPPALKLPAAIQAGLAGKRLSIAKDGAISTATP